MDLRSPATPNLQRDVYSVSRLNQEVRMLLEGSFPLLWVEGEISNLARPGSGHWYFTLKDREAQIRCAMFRNRNQLLRARPRDGDQVLMRARVSLYPARGDFQLIVEHMEPAGDGLLRRAFEELKARLQAEGLFDAERKRPLPPMPRRLGIITSPTGAAVHDVLTVLRRRFPALDVLLYPVPVQGEYAAEKIAHAIELAGHRAETDLLLLTRGGGSLEDLWAFNEEVVARAVAASKLPIVCAVGHEVDFSIAEFAADQRAPTPSAAAELISPDGDALYALLTQQDRRLRDAFGGRLRRVNDTLGWLEHRLQQRHPGRRLQDQSQHLDDLEKRLQMHVRGRLDRSNMQLHHLRERMSSCSPRERLVTLAQRQQELSSRLQRAVLHLHEQRRLKFQQLARTLETVSPLATLGRGYSILRNDAGEVVRGADQVSPGETLDARLGSGRLSCEVRRVLRDSDD